MTSWELAKLLLDGPNFEVGLDVEEYFEGVEKVETWLGYVSIVSTGQVPRSKE